VGTKARYRKLRQLHGSGPIPWPPPPADGQRGIYLSTREIWADVLWTIAHAGGSIVSETGQATAALYEQLADPDRTNQTNVGLRVNELVDLGLVDVDRRGKRTYAIGLTVAADRLPMRDPHAAPAPAASAVVAEPEAVDTARTTSAPPRSCRASSRRLSTSRSSSCRRCSTTTQPASRPRCSVRYSPSSPAPQTRSCSTRRSVPNGITWPASSIVNAARRELRAGRSSGCAVS
jgi:hypothetical protein